MILAYSPSIMELKQAPKAGAEAETTEEYCSLLACVQSCPLSIARTHLPRDGSSHSGQHLLARKCPIAMSPGQSDGGNSSTVGPSSQVCQADKQGQSSQCSV